MDEGFKIKIGVDMGEVSKSLRQLDVDLKGFQKKLESATSVQSIAALNKSIAETKSRMEAIKGIKGLDAIPAGANQAGNALMNLGRIAQDAPFGFIGISNNISPLLESFQRLKTETGSTGGALNALGASLLGGGGLGLAVSVATGLLVVFGDKLFASKKATDEAAESAKRYADAQKSTAESLQKQVINVESLVRIATSDVSTKKDQANAIARLNELIPDNVGKLSALNIKTEEGIGIIRRYTQALEDQATAELLRGRAAEIRVKLFDSERTALDQIRKLEDARAEVQARMSQGNDKATVEERQSEAFKRGTGLMLAEIVNYDNRIKQIRADLSKSTDGLNGELDKLREGIDKNTKGGLPLEIKAPKVDKTDALKKQIADLEAYGKAVGYTAAEFQKLTDLRSKLVIRDQVKLGLDPEQLKKQLNDIRNSNEFLEQQKALLDGVAKTAGLIQSEKLEKLNIDVAIAINEADKTDLDPNQLQRTIDAIYKDAALKVPVSLAFDESSRAAISARGLDLPTIPVRIVPKLDATEKMLFTDQVKSIKTTLATQDFDLTSNFNLKPGLNKAFFEAERQAKSAGEALAAAIEGSIENGLGSIGEALGSAIAGGGLQNLFGSFVSALADGLKSIGKAIIAYAVGIDAIKKAIKNPYIAVAAGVGMIVAGAALQQTIAARKFATGGIVTGPTNALIGEAGPEVVFPLNQIQRFLNQHTTGNANGSGVFIADTRISGEDLVTSYHRVAGKRGGTSSFGF